MAYIVALAVLLIAQPLVLLVGCLVALLAVLSGDGALAIVALSGAGLVVLCAKSTLDWLIDRGGPR